MIKEHGNVRKRTKKNIGRQPHIKVYRDGVKTSKRYTFFNFVRFQIFLRFPFRRFTKKNWQILCCSNMVFCFDLQLHIWLF